MEFGLLILRLVVGLTMAAHGAQKLFGWFGGYGIEGTGGWLESLGFRNGRAHATLVGASEFGGGLLLALGLLTPLGAAAVIGVMIVAIATVHWDKGFFVTGGGYEFNLLMIAATLTIAVAGPGMLAFDDIFGFSFSGFAWGFLALVVASIAAGIVLGLRRSNDEVSTEETTTEEVREQRAA